MRSKLSLVTLALVLTLGIASCGVAPNRRISRATPEVPVVLNRASTTLDQAVCGPVASSKPPVTGSHASTIANAYQAVLRVYVRPDDLHTNTLLSSAWQGALNEVTKEGATDP